ncbi:MAG: TIGR02594 family protein [Polyangiales bacterium]
MGTSPSRPDYEELYRTAQIDASRRSALASTVNVMVRHRDVYEQISAKAAVPWWLVAALHKKESNLDFNSHLHNGDPLSARTTRVPPGRIPGVEPPYTFSQSAIDALSMKRRTFPAQWDIEGTLGFVERYNGLGYRNKNIYSPYVWCGTQHYTRGKYVRDHEFDPSAVSTNLGVAPVLMMLEERGLCDLDRSDLIQHDAPVVAEDQNELGATPWMQVARAELGQAELPGRSSNARIVEYFRSTRLAASRDETPWCAAFVCFCLERAGLRSTHSALARSFEAYGVPGDGSLGDIAVFWTGSPDGAKGHVAFVERVEGESIFCLGGNQSDGQQDSVNIKPYPRSRLIAFRRPLAGV